MEAYSKGYQPDVQAQSVGNHEDGDLPPIVYLMANMTGSILDPAIHRTLLDSGSGKTLISKSALPPGTEIQVTEQDEQMNTMAGIFKPLGYVILKDLWMPEFDKNLPIYDQMCYVFDTPCRYQIIAGQDFLQRTGIDLGFKKNHIT